MDEIPFSHTKMQDLVDRLRALCKTPAEWGMTQVEYRRRFAETIGLNPIPVLQEMLDDEEKRWLR